ncbi:MAG: recombinase family protein [Clostridia bacterium]|nr:recombinase family protein [Clostridia bacterium]
MSQDSQYQHVQNLKSIALYCRVSTDEQAREGVSLDEQQERLKAYCRAMNWTTPPLLFIDDGYSAKSIERPALTKLLSAIRAEQVSKVMVTKLDRMSRRLLDLLTMIDLFQKSDVSFVSISESFDTNTPSGRLTLQVLGAVAEFERERIRERVIDNMMHAAKGGKWLTQSPYGYRLEEKQLVVFETEAEIVKRIFAMFLHKGLGYYSIAKQFNHEGIPSRQNKEWSIRSVKLLLSNPVYKGTLVWNRVDSSKKSRQLKDVDDWIVVHNCLPEIIDEDIWEQTQKRINEPNKMAPRAKTSPHLLGGLIKCGSCDAGMSIGWSGWPKRYRVYRCSANKNKGTCTSKQYRADEVESWFKEGLNKLAVMSTGWLKLQMVQKVTAFQQTDVEQKLRSAKARYKRKIEAYTAGLIDLADLTEEKRKVDQEIAETKKNSAQSTAYDLQLLEKSIIGKIKNSMDAINNLPVVEAKALLVTLLEHMVLVGEKDIEIKLKI